MNYKHAQLIHQLGLLNLWYGQWKVSRRLVQQIQCTMIKFLL